MRALNHSSPAHTEPELRRARWPRKITAGGWGEVTRGKPVGPVDEDPSMGLGSNPGLPLTSSETLGGFLILLASISCKMGTTMESPQGTLRPILQMCKLRPRAGPHSSKVPP